MCSCNHISFIAFQLALQPRCEAALPGCLSLLCTLHILHLRLHPCLRSKCSRCSCVCWVRLIPSRPPRARNAPHARQARETRRAGVTLSLGQFLRLLVDCAFHWSLAAAGGTRHLSLASGADALTCLWLWRWCSLAGAVDTGGSRLL